MKSLRNLLFVLIFVGCNSTNQEEKIVKVFNDTFGEKNTKALDEIVLHGENLLMNAYDVQTVNEAYGLFLTQVANVWIDNLEIGLTVEEAQSFVDLFETDSLKYSIFEFSVIKGNKVYEFDKVGPFMETLKQLEPISDIASEYYNTIMTAGSISYSLLANGLLERYVEFDNYILKRIIIVDILYRHCTLKLLRTVS